MKTRRTGALVLVLGTVAGIVFLVTGRGGSTGDDPLDARPGDTRSMDPSEARLDARSGSASASIDGVRTEAVKAVAGRLVWKDGAVVTGGLVRRGPREVGADAAGFFSVPLGSMASAGAPIPVELAIKAPCWSSWSDVAAVGRWSEETSRVELGDVVLENEIDLAADLTWSSEFAEILAVAGVEAIDLQVKTATADRPGGLQLGNGNASIRDRKLHLDLRIRDSEVAALQLRLRVPRRPQAIPAEQVRLYRNSTNHWVRSLGVEDLVRGRIVDQLGADLPEATLDMSVHGTRTVPKPLFLPVHVNENGRFVAYLDRRNGATIRAACFGTKGVLMEVASGPEDLVVRLDMSAHPLIHLRRGSEPIAEFSMSDQPILFGRTEVQRLERHERGACWCPKWKFPVHAFVAWREGELQWEELVELPSPDAQGTITIDLDSLVPQILGTVSVQNPGRGCSVTLTRVDPAPPAPKYRLTRTFDNERDATITGVPAGRYEVDIMTGGFRTDAERHFRTSMVLGSDHDRIAVAEIIANGK